jgi:chaperonin GroES
VQFQARAYPAIVPGREIARAEVVGVDPDGSKRERAKRVGEHMSYQLTKQIKNWEEDTDRMLVVLPIEGTCFRKTYFDPRLGRPCSELVRAMDFVVHYKARGLDVAPRATHEFPLYPHTIEERKRAGVYLDVDLSKPNSAENDADAPHDMLEQHRLWDLDEDGYPEPYIVTVHKDTAKVLRIVAAYDMDGIFTAAGSVGDILRNTVGAAQSVGLDPQAAVQAVMPHLTGAQIIRIERSSYFTKYGFIPNPESAIYDLGFGMLLNPINETVNTVLNQMLDAGTLANTGGGFIGSGVRMKSGSFKFTPGEYKRVDATGADLKSNIVPLQFSGPSKALDLDAGFAFRHNDGLQLTSGFRQPRNHVPVARRDGRIASRQRRTEVAPTPAFDAAIGQFAGQRHRTSSATTPS